MSGRGRSSRVAHPRNVFSESKGGLAERHTSPKKSLIGTAVRVFISKARGGSGVSLLAARTKDFRIGKLSLRPPQLFRTPSAAASEPGLAPACLFAVAEIEKALSTSK